MPTIQEAYRLILESALHGDRAADNARTILASWRQIHGPDEASRRRDELRQLVQQGAIGFANREQQARDEGDPDQASFRLNVGRRLERASDALRH